MLGTVTPDTASLDTASGVRHSFNLTVLVGTNTAETLTNVASIFTNIDNNPANNQDTAITYIVQPVVDLSITKSAPAEVAPGQKMVYHITYRNKGNTDAGSVTITDELPAGVIYYDDNSDFGTSTDGNKITWHLGTVSPSLWAKSFKITVEVDNLPAGILVNKIKIKDNNAIDSNPSDNQATATTRVVMPVSDLAVHKIGPNDVTPNSVITYHIGYKNKGNIEVGSVTITDTLPVGVNYLNDNSGYSTSTTNSQITWQIGTLKPGQEGRFIVTALIGQIQGSSTLTNSVMISSPSIYEDDMSNNMAVVTSHVVLPSTDLLVNKFGPKSVAPNQEMTYKITCANLGNSEARDVEIIDTLPAGVAYKNDTSGISPLLLGDMVIWQVPAIPANTSKSFELTVFVGDMQASITMTNQIKITTLANDTDPDNNNAIWQTHIADRKADVMVIKESTGARPGFDMTYYITYKNIGTDRAEEVVVIDYLPAGAIYLSSSPQGNYDTTNHSLTWNIGDINASDGGNITVYTNVDGDTTKPGDELKNTVKISTISFEKRYDNNVFVGRETVFGSIDPNDKLASPQDFLSEIRDVREINYKIRFENIVGSYTLAAREVRIVDKLDNNMDWDTLEIGDIGIGTRTYQLGTWSHGTTYGTVSYNFNKTTGSLTWYFVGVDSSLPPIKTGFLPPNENKPEGEGHVSYSIKAKDSVTTGTIIRNKANIRFDFNEWIETPEIYHIFDATPPSATVTVAPSQGTITFEVAWVGTDTVGSISSYTLYVSDETPPQTATVWIAGTTATSAWFTGTVGTTYYFFVVAEDMAGNKGQMSAPVKTTIILDANIDHVEITPGSSTTLELNQTQLFVITAKNKEGHDVAGTFTWQLSGNIGTITTMAGSSTLFSATGIGKGTLTATADGGTKTSVVITVVAGDVHSISISPNTGTLTAGEERVLTAIAYNQAGATRTGISCNWQIVSGQGTITTAATGTAMTVKATGTGTLIVTASSGTITGTATFLVIAGSASIVTVTPSTPRVVVGTQQIFTVNTVNQFGWQIPGLSYTWQISDNIGTIAATTANTMTFIAATKTGNGQIKAMTNGATGTTAIDVKAGTITQLAILGTATVKAGMPVELNVQLQDEYGNVNSGTIAVGITLTATNNNSMFCSLATGAIWTTTNIVTIAANANTASFFFKHNGTDTPVTITARASNLATATLTITVESIGSQTVGQIIGDDGRTKLLIGTRTLVGTGYIQITSTVSTSYQSAFDAANVVDDADKRMDRVEGTLRHFNPQGVSATFTANGTITIPYQAEGGFVSGTKIREDRLKIYRLTQVSDGWRWIEVPGSKVDAVAKTVSAPVTHLFSYFILMGPGFEINLNQVIVYPNPYLQDKHGYSIFFDRLTENSTIKIFNIAGELVREIDVKSSLQAWDAENSNGEKVASGIYIYLITDSVGNKAVGKLAIIR